MEFLPFFLILLATVLFSAAFRKFHLPWVLALISAGVVVGPQGLGIATITPTIDFLSQVGLIFLMFMAGLEIKYDGFKKLGKEIAWLAAINGLAPFAIGVLVGIFLGYPAIASVLLGIIFMSSSIAVIIPTLESFNLSNTKLGRSIVASTMVVDVASLILLSMLLQIVEPVTALPLPSFYFIVTLIMFGFAYALPRIRGMFPVYRDEKDLFQSEVRIVFALMIGVVVTFELLGLHPIIAGFFAGLVMSQSIKSELVIDKLRTMSYGIFIPVFFVAIGMETNIHVLTESADAVGLVAIIVAASVLSKFLSGWLGGRAIGFNNLDASIIGLATTPQLSTTLAVAFTAVELHLIPSALITALVMLSVITTLIAPIGLRFLALKKSKAS